MNKRIKVLVTSLALVFCVNSSVFAQPQNGASLSGASTVQQEQNAVESIKDRKQELELKIEHFDNEIEEAMRKVDKSKTEVTTTEEDIKATESTIIKVKSDLSEKQEISNERIRKMYINGGVISYVELLLTSKGIGDLISKTEAFVKIMEFDKKIFAELNEGKLKLEDKKGELEEYSKKLVMLLKENEVELSRLQDNKNEQKKLLVAIKNEEKSLNTNMQNNQSQINTLLKQMNNSNLATASLSRGATFSSSEIIAYASKFIGTPYLWGGTSPKTGFDCSGFTQYVYAHFGISLGRTTFDQINDGLSISKNELRTGDLVFFGTLSNPHHMGIYIGDNYYIHAPQTGDVVKVSLMSRPDFVKGVRVR